MPSGGLFIIALFSLFLSGYTILFRKEALQSLSSLIRRLFWAYFILSALIVVWSLAALLAGHFSGAG